MFFFKYLYVYIYIYIYLQPKLPACIAWYLNFSPSKCKNALSVAHWRGLYCADAHLDANDADGAKRSYPLAAHHVRTSGNWDAIHSTFRGMKLLTSPTNTELCNDHARDKRLVSLTNIWMTYSLFDRSTMYSHVISRWIMLPSPVLFWTTMDTMSSWLWHA